MDGDEENDRIYPRLTEEQLDSVLDDLKEHLALMELLRTPPIVETLQ